MAVRIEIPKKTLEYCIDMAVASSKRAINTSKRPEFEEIYKREISELTAARASITEIK